MMIESTRSLKKSFEKISLSSGPQSLSRPIIPVIHVSRNSSILQKKPKHRKKQHRRITPISVQSNAVQDNESISNFQIQSTTHTDSILINEKNNSQVSSQYAAYDTTQLRRTLFKRQRKRRNCSLYWVYSWPCCILCCTLLVLLSAIALTALLINLAEKTTVTTGGISRAASSSFTTSSSTVSTSTVSTTSSSTISTSTTTTTSTVSTTSSSTTSTPTTSTTTTTRKNCGSTCVNQTWISSSNILAKWLFDGSFHDQTSIRNATGVNNPVFSTGYVDLGLSLNAIMNQSLSAPHLPLSNTSFTITAWINVAGYPSPTLHSLFGICSVTASRRCLTIAIRRNAANYFLYMDFFNSSCQGTVNILINTWYHIGFVFDLTTMTQLIYLNGLLDQSCSVVSAPLILTSTTLTTIGSIPLLIPLNGINFYHGKIDQMIVNQRVKSSCELFEEAALVTRFEFDSPSTDIDLGPNNLPGGGIQYTFLPSTRSPQGISLAGNNESHFKIGDISVLGIDSHAFSIIYWIQPKNLSGSIVHLASSSDGRGWCLPYMGFTAQGLLFAEILTGGVIKAVTAPGLLPTQSWSHVAQTWSPANGLRLYVNATLVAADSTLTFNTASGAPMYVFLGSGVTGLFHCAIGFLPGTIPFPGAIDDFRIYNRELTAIDLCTILVDS